MNASSAAGAVAPDFGLPHVAQAIARKQLDIVVIGSASSELNGPGGTSIAYPVRLEAALRQAAARRRRQGYDLCASRGKPRPKWKTSWGGSSPQTKPASGRLADRHRRCHSRHRSG